MKICFFHQPFDVDVSSGTIHVRHQWHELASAFGVTDMAVINETEDPFLAVNDSVKVCEYKYLNQILQQHQCVLIERGPYPDHRSMRIPDEHWIVFGGAQGLPDNHDHPILSINTKSPLYPREAAAIVLENQWVLSHS